MVLPVPVDENAVCKMEEGAGRVVGGRRIGNQISDSEL